MLLFSSISSLWLYTSVYIPCSYVSDIRTKSHARLSDEMPLVLNDRDQTLGVDLGDKPVGFQLQVNVDFIVWNLLCCHNQAYSLKGQKGESTCILQLDLLQPLTLYNYRYIAKLLLTVHGSTNESFGPAMPGKVKFIIHVGKPSGTYAYGFGAIWEIWGFLLLCSKVMA